MHRDRGEKRHFLRKYEMRWGINEVETQEGGSRWLERSLCLGGERRCGRRRARRPGGARLWQEERPRVPQEKGLGVSLGCVGPCLLCFSLEVKPSSQAVQTPHRLGHGEVPGILGAVFWKVSGNGCKSNKSLTLTLPSSALYSQLGIENYCRID